jgi:hypothetical protein
VVQEAWIPHFLHEPRLTGYPNRQYRLYLDGADVTFSEDDWFLAGIVLYWEYEALGISREAGIAELERIGGTSRSPRSSPEADSGTRWCNP